jgi:hypothetical protein
MTDQAKDYVSKKINIIKQVQNFVTYTSRYSELDDGGEEPAPAWSVSINAGMIHLQNIIADSMPELNAQEWQIILNTYAGCMINSPARTPIRIASDILNDRGAESVDNLDDDTKALVLKIHTMNQAQQTAILYFTQAFWAKSWRDYKDFDDIKKQIYQILGKR